MADTTTTWNGRERRGPGRLDDEARARALLAQSRAGGPGADAAREALVLQFRPLVLRQAGQFLGSPVPLEDLVQEGFIGLMHAVDQFSLERGVKFITYAVHHIDGHLRHFLRDRSQIIKEPGWLQEMAQKVKRQTERVTQQTGHEPTEAEVAQALGLREKEVARINATRATFQVSSLDEAEEMGGTHVAAANLEAAAVQLPLEDRLVLEHALARLKEIEQKALYAYYYEDKTKAEIARALGVSHSYVHNLLQATARKLEEMFHVDAVREAALQHERLLGDVAASTVVDSVTGLYTRGYFDARLDEELSRARRHGLELSVLRVAVGSDLPEASLFAEMAQTVKSCTRRSDLVARADEREIAALLPHTGQTREAVVHRVQSRLSAWQSGLPHPCTITLGIASYPGHRQRQALLSAAAPRTSVAAPG